METIDYNGQGDWTSDAILQRYTRYCQQLKVGNSIKLIPKTLVQGNKKWIYPAMGIVIEGIEEGDIACKWIGIEFIEQDQKFSFGKILKSNTARALRRAELDEEDKERIRKRLVNMLLTGNVPHEYKEYAKLLKKVGLESYRESLEESIKSQLRVRLQYSKAIILLVGEKTKYLYKFVRWELEYAMNNNLPIIAVNINGKRDRDIDRCPAIIRDELVVHVSFNHKIIKYALDNWPNSYKKLKAGGEKGGRYYPDEIYKNHGL